MDWAGILNEPETWTGIGLLIFIIALVALKVPAQMTKSLDDRALKIRSELDNAAALRKEAEAKLADAERRQVEAEAQAKEIIEVARREAERFASDARAALTESLARREQLAKERIARAEAEAVRDVRLAAADTASRAAATILTEQLVGKAADDHLAASLETVKKALAQ